MEIERSRTLCFTGVKPERLPDRGERTSIRTKVLRSIMYNEMLAAIDRGYNVFMTGMRRGIELWAGETALELRNSRHIKLVAVLPFRGFGADYRGAELWIFSRIMSEADVIVTVCEENIRGCGHISDRFMVQQSAGIIGAAGSGDEHTDAYRAFRYAAQKGLDIIQMDPAVMFYEAEKYLDKNDPFHFIFKDYDVRAMAKGKGITRVAGRISAKNIPENAIGNVPDKSDMKPDNEEKWETFMEANKDIRSDMKREAAEASRETPEKAAGEPSEEATREDPGETSPGVTDKINWATLKETMKKTLDETNRKIKELSTQSPGSKAVRKSRIKSAEKSPAKMSHKHSTAPVTVTGEEAASRTANADSLKLEDIIESRYSCVLDDTLELK